ncbi:hypothetical protein DFJ67_7038 [Asanoa ferruginea]|uniref:Secreted protein n=1 Tax=Asanoa ferruginea TaxID=53367 RepID=A0A3D9ZUA1_9ACTN|nr:hypothetical protein [Asanoa ferruginea]REG00967.1 hypothetical protein DFJ67_7038 [Asanoa ferruginea]GIF47566.1 hypothetical protein Afe04nite_21050 [Asanoa ferruginea]
MRTAIRAAAAILVALTAGALVAPSAQAATARSGQAQCGLVDVVDGTDDFTSPASVASGVRTFQVTTADPSGIVLGLFRLDDGVAINDFLTLLRVAFAGQGDQRVEAGRQVQAQSTLLGGVSAVTGRPATFTQTLVPGTYYLINYRDILANPNGAVGVHPLTATNQWVACSPPIPRATVQMIDTADGPRYLAPTSLRQGAPILVVNLSGRIQEAVIRPVGPNVTATDIELFFQAVDNGQPPPSIPFVGLLPQGMPVIHSPLAAIIQPNLAPGRYAMLSFLLDDEGVRYAASGTVVVFDVI